MKKLLFIILFSLTFSSGAFAQQDEQMSMYMFNPLYFNPAYAGSKDLISAVAVGRFQWINFSGTPRSQWFSVHAPLFFKSLGVGGHMVNDIIGKRKRTSVYGDLSGSIQVSKKNQSRIALGVSFGVDVLGYDFTDATVIDTDDPFYGQRVNTTKPNVGAGIYYYGKKHYIGISSPRLLEEMIKNQQDLEKQVSARHFFLAAGYVFDLNSVLKLKPSALVKYTPKAPITFDVNLSLLSYKMLWTGIMYRYNESIGANVGIIIKDFTIGYHYDFPINGIRTYQNGTHEVFLQLDIRTKKTSYTSPRYF